MPEGQEAAAAADAALVLRTLGGAALESISGDGCHLLLLGPGKTLGLLAYLASSAGHTATRDHLADLFWSDLDPDAARHSLRHALWQLRQHVGEGAIVATDGSLTLVAAVESDRDAFLAAAERQDFECAVELYRGEFFPGFAAPGAAGFEQWADVERYRLRHLFLRSAETVVRDWLARGRLRKARQLAARARDSDRRNEAGWRLLLECILAANDVVAAELEVHALEELLKAEGRPPEPATGRTIARVRAEPRERPQRSADGARRTLVAELVGRERQFSAILAAWERARHGPGQHVHVTGSPGLGKTRLLADVHARLRSMGAAAISIRANPGEQRIPFALASELAVTLAGLSGSAALSPGSAAALVALNPSLSNRYVAQPDRAADSEALRHRATALEEVGAAVADEQPFAVLVDDLHWADAESRQLFQSLLPKLGRHRVLVVTADRPGSGAVMSEDTEWVSLPPLTSQQTAALLASLGVLPAAPWAETFAPGLHAATHGSPLLVTETLRLALERGLLSLDDGLWDCPDPAALAAEFLRGGALRRRIEALERHEYWLLLLLALAGAPMPAASLAAAGSRDEGATADELTSLEVRGLVGRDGAEWQPGHDEIGALALEAASPEALHAAHRALGRALVEAAGEDPILLSRAGVHLSEGDDEAGLRDAFARWARVVRRHGDRRGLARLASDFGGGAAGGRARRLVASLPLTTRARLVTRRTLAGAASAAGLLAAAGGYALLRPAPPPPDAELVAIQRISSDSAVVYQVPVRRDWLETHGSVDVARTGAALPSLDRAGAAEFATGAFAAAPDGDRWAFARVSPDSGGPDLFVVDRGGVERRLTYAPKDDGSADWAPDGQSLAFQTGRWNASGRSNIALLSLATGRVTRLTSTDNSDGSPKWSPDGTRIAFTRMSVSTARAPVPGQSESELCWVPIGGGPERCFDAQSAVAELLGWYDGQQVLATVLDSLGRRSLVRVDLDTRESHIVSQHMTGSFVASADGRWIACLCERAGASAPAWYVFDTDRPDLAIPVVVPGPAASTRLFWQRRANTSTYLDRLEIVAPAARVSLGGLERLQVRGYDGGGRAVPVLVLTWRSGDTSVLTIDSATGEVHPRRLGTAVAYASAGGWREDSIRLDVTEPAYSTLLIEDWGRGLAQWVPFGDPLPAVTTGPGGRRAFWNNGDRSFYSGAYTRRGFRNPSGIGVEALLSTPVRAFQDQILLVSLMPWTDSVSVARWDHRTASLPMGPQCTFQYPPADGPAPMRAVGFDRWIDVGPMLAAKPYTIRIQLFPDGRCGLALNGRALSVTASALPTAVPYRLVLQGKSVGNRMLVGRLEVWEGVKPGVDWAAAPR